MNDRVASEFLINAYTVALFYLLPLLVSGGQAAREAFTADLASFKLEPPKNFTVDIEHKKHFLAYRGSFYSEARVKGAGSSSPRSLGARS